MKQIIFIQKYFLPHFLKKILTCLVLYSPNKILTKKLITKNNTKKWRILAKKVTQNNTKKQIIFMQTFNKNISHLI